ncbi:hypothetical protein [Hydrogenothermus marinus]|uniref:Uncharacterized protein n=1 Tax=Hydrogenothermus marinus TaxID=133270 RepID=A0A3M0BSU3_9AQUI|nr:hypothetical protein [Hydrogenothermus marinus]RMA97898.1 hypothetical protein CLV39_0534 [Hydrogenothermus marinus]
MKDCYYANTFSKEVPCNPLSYLAYKAAIKEGKNEDLARKFQYSCYYGCNKYKNNLKLPSYQEFKTAMCNF